MTRKFILGAHNAWSYLTPKKWWMKLIRFTAKCQKYDIVWQYEELGVRDFDLRVRMNEETGDPMIVHGIVEFEYTPEQIEEDLQYLNLRGDCSVRIMLDVRKEEDYTEEQVKRFKAYCNYLYVLYYSIKFWGGKNLYNYNVEYDFPYKPTVTGRYSSVCPPKIIDDWWPWLYARLHNHKNLQEEYDVDILHIDFVNIQ